MADCYVPGKLINDALCRLATQYRDSTNMKAYFAVFLAELELVQKALCDSLDFDLDRLGKVLDFPRNWCNIKRRVWFGFERPPTTYFGFSYDDGEPVVVEEACLSGLDEGRWFELGNNEDCNVASIQNCCTSGDPTVKGFCEADFICVDYPQHIDHTFSDDVEYAMLIQAKLLSDNSTGTIDDMLDVAIIMYGSTTTIFYDNHGVVWIALNRDITENEILLMDFYKNLIPAPNGVSINIVTGLQKQFGFTGVSTCLTGSIDGFCDSALMRRY